MLRTHTCGELNEKNIGDSVVLCGWVDTVRDHGGLTFIDLRDRYGKTQLVFSGRLTDYKSEDCVRVKGKVQVRPKGTENSKIPTGSVEISVDAVETFSAARPLPFEVLKSRETNEDLRMQYRYLDLRNPAVQKNLFVRHRVYQMIRRQFDKHGFIEVETPILTKSTPEGARDYLVPSRLNRGEFYALPQSPQIFKQILMVSGFDRYFQIAKCFRDEDLRADRQPEFTQLDVEMSFLEEKDLFAVIEETCKIIWKEVLGIDLEPFETLTYQDAMARYGSDKPDLRFGLEFQDVSELMKDCEFKVFRDALEKKDGVVAGFCVPEAWATRKDIDDLTEFVKAQGASGLAYFKMESGGLDSPILKFFDEKTQRNLIEIFRPGPGGLLLFIADERRKTQKILGALRLQISKTSKWSRLVKAGLFRFAWVKDFPLFQWNEEEKRWDSEHHPFTCPHLEDWVKYKSAGEFGRIRSRAYDLVLNGNEIASGSVRIHDEKLQKEIFDILGLSEKDIRERFGFLLKAFEFGAPPHGGIALGIDRVLTVLLGLDSIREVIAFPKNQKAADPMTEAPSPVDEKQLKELGLKIR
jgi:aspartyl-tRNA synthetase